MTAYQNTVFEAFANNDGQAGLSKKDILSASQMAKNGTLTGDVSSELPAGYKVEKAKYFGAGVGAQVHVKHNKQNSEATLNFKVGVLSSKKPKIKNLKKASVRVQTNNLTKPQQKTEESVLGTAKNWLKTGLDKLTSSFEPQKTTSARGAVNVAMSMGAASAKAKKPAVSTPTKVQGVVRPEINPAKDKATTLPDRYKEYGTWDYDSHSYKNNFSTGGLAGVLCPAGLEHDYTDSQKSFFKSLAKEFDGKPITPNLMNNVISRALDAKAYESEAMSNVITTNIDDLSSATIDKFLRKVDRIHVGGGKFYSEPNADSMKKMYLKLNEQQREIYYQKLLKPESVVGSWATTGDEMSSNFTDYIFEKPVSAATYNKLIYIITDLNKSCNGISKSKTASKEAINTLLQRGQITQAQANELYKAAGLSK